MAIDGVGGPKGPVGPGGAGPIQPADHLAPGPKVDQPFGIPDRPEATAPEAARGEPAISSAVREVAQALHVGAIPSMESAYQAVLDRIVETRYAGMDLQEQRRFASYLREILADDPVMGERIRALLQNALDQLEQGSR